MNQTSHDKAGSKSSGGQQRLLNPERLARSMSLAMHDSSTPGRQRLEACIAGRFAQQYQAQVKHFLPYILSLNESGELGAAVGIQPAGSSPLFLERYLDVRIEQAISSVFRCPVDREQVVEIGNLAAAVPGTAVLLFVLLANVLDRAGVRWVSCTATPQVKVMLASLQFPAHTICDANAAALGEQAQEWGSYYASRPQVIVGDTRVAATIALQLPMVTRLIAELGETINELADTLRAERQQ